MKILENLRYNVGMFAGDPETVRLDVSHYANGRLAIQLLCPMEDEDLNLQGMWEPFAVCTVNLPDEDCPEGEVWVKDWSENAGMTEFLIENSIIEQGPTCNAHSGYVQVHRYKLTPEFLGKVTEQLVQAGERSRR